MGKATPTIFPNSTTRQFRPATGDNLPETAGKEPLIIDDQYITKETVLNKRGVGIDYIITQKLMISSRLIIEEGVEICFTKNAGIEFRGNGKLKAQGSATAPIIFRGAEPDHGFWRGIYFNNDTSGNILEHCHLLHGGGSSFDGLEVHANLRLKSGAEGGGIALSHCTFNESGGDGIHIGSGNYNLTRFNNNTMQYNLRAPLSLEAGLLGVLDGLNSVCGYNGLNCVEVRGGRVFGKCQVKDAGIPYLFKDISMIGYGSTSAFMTIAEGVEIKFAGDARIVVTSMGSIQLQGSKDDPVHFGSSEKKKTIPVKVHPLDAGLMLNFYWYALQPAVLVTALNLGYVKKPSLLSGSPDQMVVIGGNLNESSHAAIPARLKRGRKYRLAG
ncbi:MAG: hypothetical protein WD077_12110 [Bacteroidia bacterium]